MIRIRVQKWQGEFKVQELIEVGGRVEAHTFLAKKTLERAEQVARELCKRFGLDQKSVEYSI